MQFTIYAHKNINNAINKFDINLNLNNFLRIIN